MEKEKIIEAYNSGKSMRTIANEFHTYPTTIKRILERNKIELRHDVKRKGEFYVEKGEELIKWAKAQGRLVTKEELAKIAGTKRLSPSYFMKYPELGRYVKTRGQKDIQYYDNILYAWLKQNGILYKPNDKKCLGVLVTALLLGEYSNIVLQIAIKSEYVSLKKYSESMIEKKNRAHEKDMTILFLHKADFKDLDKLKERLTTLI